MAPPAFPRDADLLEFQAGPSSRSFRFFVDSASLSVGAEGVIRYVLVAESTSGARNVTFEAIRCRAGVYRIYATGHRDGTWSARPGEWRSIAAGSGQYWHRALAQDYFCPMGSHILSRAEGLDALRRGAHPLTREQAR